MKKLISILLVSAMSFAMLLAYGCTTEDIKLPTTYTVENTAEYSDTVSFPDMSGYITELSAETMAEIQLGEDNSYFDEESGIKYQSNAFEDEWKLLYEVDGTEVASSFRELDASGNCVLDTIFCTDTERLIYLARHGKEEFVLQKDTHSTDAKTGAELSAVYTYTQEGKLVHIMTKQVEKNGSETVAEYDGTNKFLGASVKLVSGGNKYIGGYDSEGSLSYCMRMDRKGKATYHDGNGKQVDYETYRRLISDASPGGWLEMVTDD